MLSISGLCLCKLWLELIKHGNPFTDFEETLIVPRRTFKLDEDHKLKHTISKIFIGSGNGVHTLLE